MARVLYGVHGTGRGHAVRALVVARHYSSHEFLFVSHGEGARMLREQFQVLDCPNPITQVDAHRVQFLPTVLRTGAVLTEGRRWRREVRHAAGRFSPDVAITDYEFFVPRVARALGLPCLSLDNQHALTEGRPDFPSGQLLSSLGTSLSVRLLFSSADQYLISCFFDVSPRDADPLVRWAPSLVRDEVTSLRTHQGDHVVAYQGYATFPRFIDALGALGRPVHLYGQGSGPSRGSLSFEDFREQAFLEDLATCAYVVCGGGHTLISEALHLGKPVLSIPVTGMFEQFLNAHYLERCGYGSRSSIGSFSIHTLRDFERRLDACRDRIRAHDFCGNQAVFAAVDDFIAGRWRRPQGLGLPPAT